MKPISHADLVALLRPHDPPCVSLHVPVDGREGAGPASVKLANAVRSVKPRLEAWATAGGNPEATARVSARLHDLVERLSADPWEPVDGAWRAPTRGLTLFVAPNFSSLHRMPEPPAEMASCDDAFHARPLLEQHAANVRFHLLAIHRDLVRLFDGCAERLDEMPLGDIPASFEQAVGAAYDDSQQGASFHGSPATGKGRGNAAAQGVHAHGFGGKERDDEKDATRFLLRIGHGLPRGLGSNGSPPLVVMAVDKTLGLFRKLHPNVQLAEGGIALDPGGRTAEELHQRAWQALLPLREKRLSEILDALEAALPRNRASKDLVAIARAAVAGRVDTLVLAHGKHDAGRLDPQTGELHLDGPGGSGPDVLEQLAAAVLLHRGEILVAPPDRLQSHAGALYRY